MLVVCLGNICRSPAGEAALREAAGEAGLEISVESAGTGPWHVGRPPDRQVQAAGRRAGLEIDGTGRQITRGVELADYDIVLAMDRSNLRALRDMAPDLGDRIHLYRSFDPTAESDEMPDPYGMSDTAFDATVRMARAAARGIVEAIRHGRLP